MNHATNGLDFSNERFFIGLDVHKKQWAVSIRHRGEQLRRFVMDPSPEALHQYMSRNYPGGRYFSVYEAGFCGFWIHRRLCAYGIENIVVNPADVSTTGKERANKTDKRDANKLSREREKGDLEAIYVPEPEMQQLRTVWRLRNRQISHQTRLKNRIKGFCHFYGIQLPEHCELSHWSGAFMRHLRLVDVGGEINRFSLDLMLDQLEDCRKDVVRLTKQLRFILEQPPHQEIASLLRTVPGIGPIISMAIYCELMDMGRFETFDELCGLVGLVPAERESGPNRTTLGLTHRRNGYLRDMLIEAAWVAKRKDPALTMAFNKLVQRMDPNRAIIRIAQKLLRRIRSVWKNRQPYVLCVVR